MVKNTTHCTDALRGNFRVVILGDDERINEEGEVVAIEVEEVEEPLECKTLGLLGMFDDEKSASKTMRVEG